VQIRRGKSGKRREVGTDRWGWEQLDPWLKRLASLPIGALLCVLRDPTSGRPCAPAGIRAELRDATAAGVRRRFAPPAEPCTPSRCPAKASRSSSSSAS
jgi:hypothetical protein